MASPVGAILFFAPNHTSHFPLPFPTFIYHFHLPLPRLVPSGCYPMAGRVHSVRPVPFLCQIPILPEPLPDGTPLQCPGQQQISSAPPAGNKPHLAERSTPVWLAIWCIWAGFANSQHRYAAFATPDNICAHSSLLQTLSSCSDRRKSVGPSAPIAYATSVSPPDEAAAWPGARVLGAG